MIRKTFQSQFRILFFFPAFCLSKNLEYISGRYKTAQNGNLGRTVHLFSTRKVNFSIGQRKLRVSRSTFQSPNKWY